MIVDGADNFPTRYLVNDASVWHDIPVVHGSIYRFEGQVTVFKPHEGPCYRCLFPQPPPPELAPSCAEGGVLGVLPGRDRLAPGERGAEARARDRRAARSDGCCSSTRSTATFDEVALRRDPDLPGLRRHPTITEYIDYVEFCAGPHTHRMSIVRIPPTLRAERAASGRCSREGAPSARCSTTSSSRFPALGARILDNGGVAPFVNVYVEGEDVRTREGLDTAVGEASTVILLPAMAGG